MQTKFRYLVKIAVVFALLMGMLGTGFNLSVAQAASCTPASGDPVIDLYAKAGTAMLYGSTSVTIWGYSTSLGGSATLPNPVLEVNEGDCVQVNLTNVDIPEATSLLFQGQSMIPDTNGVTDGVGVNTTSYVFSADKPGTFLYEAGLIPGMQHQVAMGMYGALIVRPATAGQAYTDSSTAFDGESVAVLSELDPALNDGGDPSGFDMRDYNPQYFLINGKAYPDTDVTPTFTGDPGPSNPGPGTKVLLRYVNAGLQAHAMSTLGLSQTIIAQDGEPYAYSHNVVAETIATGQTLDTLITVPASALEGDQFVLYDANMLLHNTTDAGFGGMMAFLTVGTGTPPQVDPGPSVSGLSLSPNPTNGSVDVTVSATVTDAGTNASNIQAAEFYIDGTANPANPMTAVDLAFDSTSEAVEGTITSGTLAGLSSGSHTIFVRGQDSATPANWGPFASIVLNLDKTGPATTGLNLTPNPSDGSVMVTLAATGDDSTTGGSDVTSAEYWVDGGAHTAMTVAGAVSSVTNFTATIPSGLSQGTHVVSVRSQDAFGNWGAVATISLVIGDTTAPTTSNVSASPNPTNGYDGYNGDGQAVRVFADFSDVGTGDSNIVAAEGFIGSVGATGSGFVFISSGDGFNSPTESGYGDIPLASIRALSNGDYTIYVHAKDAGGNWSDFATTILTVNVDRSGPTFGPITVDPPSDTRGGGTVNVTVSGMVTDDSALNPTGSYQIIDSKDSLNVVNGTYTINPNGSFSFSVDIDRSNSGPNNPGNRRYYTFTLTATDVYGNIGTATAQFWVQ